MITAAELTLHTVKDLAEMAKKKGIPGWHSMRKQELIQALLKAARKESRQRVKKQKKATAETLKEATQRGKSPSGNGKLKAKQPKTSARSSVSSRSLEPPTSSSSSRSRLARQAKTSRSGSSPSSSNTPPRSATALPHPTDSSSSSRQRIVREVKVAPASPEIKRDAEELRAQLSEPKDLATGSSPDSPNKDRLVLMVRDSYWLQAYWEISRQNVERARAALGQNWHVARPVLRLWEIRRDGTSHSERVRVRDIEIHGRVNNWYINVDQPPRSFEVDIGYAALEGKFFCLARSNIVTTPLAVGMAPDLDWAVLADDFERVYALSGGYDETTDTTELREVLEDHLRRPLGGSVIQRLGAGVDSHTEHRSRFPFHVDVEIVVFGQIQPGYQVSVRGEPVSVGSDGRFSLRLPLPDRRHVLPVVGQSPDGGEQRTVILAIERNTKVMEPLVKDTENAV